MSSSYDFTDREEPNNFKKYVDKETDLTHESPFHTLGKGATQAASGAHRHSASEITDLPSGLAVSDSTPKADSGSGSSGVGTKAARDDHVHPAGPSGLQLGNAAPPSNAGGGSSGGSAFAAREDHFHPAVTGFAPASHAHDYSPSWHGHPSVVRVTSYDFGTFAGSETKSVTFGRNNAAEIPIAVYSVVNAVNYTWGVGFPDATSFRVHIRNQSGSSNAIGVVYVVLGQT